MKTHRHYISWRIALQIASLLCLLIGINYFSLDHYLSIDASRSRRFSLSDQGSILFSGIKQPAHIIIYFSPTSLAEESELYDDVEALMKEYKIKARENLIIEYLDPARELARAREVQGKYQFNPNENVIVIDYLDHHTVIPIKELGDYETISTSSGKKDHLIAFRGEQVINAALIKLSGVPSKKVYFLQGHGEDVPNERPLKILGSYLQHQNISIQRLNLSEMTTVPEDAGLVIIAGPHTDLLPMEAAAIKDYWLHSGRLFVLLDPTATTPLLNQLLLEIGIKPNLDRVQRKILPDQAASSTNSLFPKVASTANDVVGEFIPGTELTKQFLGFNIPLLGVTESLELAPSPTDQSIKLRPLIKAISGFISTMDTATENQNSSFNTFTSFNDNNSHHSLIIAAMADLGALHDDRVAVNASRIVVVGNSDFINDKSITDIDLDFFSSALNELIDRIQLTGNTAKMQAYLTLNLSEEKLHQIFLWCLFFIPGLAAFFGIVMIWKRS